MNKNKTRRFISLLVLFLLLPALIFVGTKLDGRVYYLISLVAIALISAPFFMLFESRKPQAREIVTLSVLCALATASRAAFTFFPHFKPMMGIVMVSAIAYGPEAGFLVGAISGFASNFFFGQGPWTPWQMFAYGLGGFLIGLVFHRKGAKKGRWATSLWGFFTVFFLVGPLLDTCTLFTMVSTITPAAAKTVYLYGLPVNFTHGLSTFATLFLVGKPLLEKLERINIKYGLMDVTG